VSDSSELLVPNREYNSSMFVGFGEDGTGGISGDVGIHAVSKVSEASRLKAGPEVRLRVELRTFSSSAWTLVGGSLGLVMCSLGVAGDPSATKTGVEGAETGVFVGTDGMWGDARRLGDMVAAKRRGDPRAEAGISILRRGFELRPRDPMKRLGICGVVECSPNISPEEEIFSEGDASDSSTWMAGASTTISGDCGGEMDSAVRGAVDSGCEIISCEASVVVTMSGEVGSDPFEESLRDSVSVWSTDTTVDESSASLVWSGDV
jgi:hypothetical protein